MTLDNHVELLGRVPLFSALPAERLKQLLRRAERIVVRPGQTIIEAGTVGEAAYLIVSGEARSAEDERLAAGTLLGQMAMLVDTEYGVTVEAVDTVRVLRFSRDMVESLIAQFPDIGFAFEGELRARFRSFAAELKEIDALLAQAEAANTVDAATATIDRLRPAASAQAESHA